MSLDSFFEGAEPRREVPSAPSETRPVRRFCARHSSHWCPCVRPDIYRAGDERGSPEFWDRIQAEDRAKREEKRRGQD